MSGPDDEARAERLAAALRENLKRRKTQMRGRQAGVAAEPSETSSGNEAGPPAGKPEGGS